MTDRKAPFLVPIGHYSQTLPHACVGYTFAWVNQTSRLGGMWQHLVWREDVRTWEEAEKVAKQMRDERRKHEKKLARKRAKRKS